MTPERWQRIESLLHAALERQPAERGAFLDGACGGEDELRKEVEALLASSEHDESFLKSPALEDAARMLAGDKTNSLLGQQIGSYQIISQLGAGGMGEVYLAHDSRLGRKVALKIVPSFFTKDEQRLRRFKQEARAATKLNHPNIVTMFDFGQVDSIHFIATEYIEGHTLRAALSAGKMEFLQAIDVAVQVAGALAAAHQAGIVHRDVKPENVMLRPDGYVKVLDFGLAKLTSTAELRDETEAQTLAMDTEPGTLMGTATYMSPEQARGLSVDARTDIFSLGVVLFEMVAGRVPFDGETTSDVIAAILEKQPPPLTKYEPHASAELQRIVTKALRKKKDERYQSIKEMLSDLKELKPGSDARARIELGRGPDLRSGSTATGSGEPATAIATAQNGDVPVRSTSSANYLIDQIKRHRRSAALAAAVIAIAATAYFFYFAGSGQPIDSIAVLPFANQNNDPETDYLSDGLTESIINSLTQLPNVRVIARSSVFRYKGRDADPMAAGKDLGVRAVLTGRIMQRGENLNVSAELVDVRDNKQLWGEQYERRVLDLMGVQREIAREISANLRLKLSGAEQSRVTKRYTENPEAYQLYLKGRYFWNKFTPADHQRATEYFNQAIAKDPAYALAYTGLADTYGASATNNWIAPTEGYPKGKAAVKKALELDETLAEAHATLGALTMFYDLDWAAAEREHKRAIELNPNYPTTYEVYSYLLSATGRLDEGIATAKRALELDPLSVPISGDTGQAYYLARRYDEAIKQIQKSIVDPNDPGVNIILGEIYQQKGLYDQAIAAYQKAIDGSERTSTILGLLGCSYASSGRRVEALKILDELKEMSGQKYVSPYDMAVLYTGLGEKDRAIEELYRAYEQRAGWVINLKVEPLFDPLRSDSRFADIVRRMNL